MGEKEKKIMERALDAYGMDQVNIMLEEMAELQKELCKFVRGEDTTEHIAEEIADVKIMIAQMIMLFDVEEQVEQYIQEKLERLSRRLETI